MLIYGVYNSDRLIFSADFVKDFQVGDIIKARILSILDDIILLKIKNCLIKAKDKSTTNYRLGDTIDFIVTSKTDNKILIKPLVDKGIEILDESNSLNFDNDKKDLIKFLLKNELQINNEYINLINETKNYYGKLMELIIKNKLPINIDILNKDIKNLIKEIIVKPEHTQDNIVNHMNNNDELKNSIIDALKNVSFSKLIFMFKNNFDFNLENLRNVHDLIINNNSIGKQLSDILKVLKKNKIEYGIYHKLNDMISKMDINSISKGKLEYSSLLNKILYELEIIKGKISNEEIVKIIEYKINQIKSSVNFLNKLNENITFVQIPINFNNHIRNLDIFVKKENKKKNKMVTNNTKIFISLNTNNLGLVQVLINIIEKSIKIYFKLSERSIKDIFENNEDTLLDALKKLDFNDIIINYKIIEKKDNIIDILFENFNIKNEIYNLDLRV